ncbi:hypothetical protein COV20_02690 [Candidatus Woesearchaeota archaeon CG10_big_fil_rev_8_21_14_0_10_45_16]|nr:MAG: hypothetical protein COV20_02690 [Candidatus Woesearchaeota archaeon CG10_big_fil_rev_8_21_14_0_10_45_16]
MDHQLMMQRMTADERRDCETLRKSLEQEFPFYQRDHAVYGNIFPGGTHLFYRATQGRCWGSTHFDISRNADRWGSIEEFEIAPEQRGQGHGRKLYRAIEQYFTETGCRTITLMSTTAGDFWQTLGFNCFDKVSFIKRIQK